MYTGNSAPSGWAICNGSSGTPDLRARFVVGAGDGTGAGNSNYSVNNTGGAEQVTLSLSQVPSHSHTINNHTHSFSASTTGGNHNHQYIDQYVVINAGYRPWPANNNDCQQRNINTSGSGSHSHSISGTTGDPNDRGTNSQGGGGSHENRPPYYALAFIMKT
jgi:microcystin-dependent protein